MLQSTSGGVVAGEPQAVTVVTIYRSCDASGSFVRTSSRSVVRSTLRRSFPYSPPAVGFVLLRWSVAGCNIHVVYHSCLFVPHAMGANFSATVLHSASQRSFLRVNLHGRSPKGPRFPATVYSPATLSMRFCFFIV